MDASNPSFKYASYEMFLLAFGSGQDKSPSPWDFAPMAKGKIDHRRGFNPRADPRSVLDSWPRHRLILLLIGCNLFWLGNDRVIPAVLYV